MQVISVQGEVRCLRLGLASPFGSDWFGLLSSSFLLLGEEEEGSRIPDSCPGKVAHY